MPDDLTTARSALSQNRDALLSRPNVVAVGVGYKVTAGETTPTLSVVVSVVRKVAPAELSPQDRVPQAVDGMPTDVVETGVLRAQQDWTARQRPAPSGVSIGHRDITAGTLGCLVRKDGQLLILSNNHVLANSNAAQAGDAILQPGPHDGGRFPADHIANLEAFAPIAFGDAPSTCGAATGAAGALNALADLLGSKARLQAVTARAADNLVDAAIARPVNPSDVSGEVLAIGPIAGVGRAELGQAVKKSGRTTHLTTGSIQQIDVTADVQYGAGRVARFTDQVMAGAMSQGGDSGSAVLDDQNRLVGLLFAGSDNTTIINRIEHVFAALGIGL